MEDEFLTGEVRSLQGQSLGVVVLKQKTFRTGSEGYYGTGKVEINGQRYQLQTQLVRIGSKAEGDDGQEGK